MGICFPTNEEHSCTLDSPCFSYHWAHFNWGDGSGSIHAIVSGVHGLGIDLEYDDGISTGNRANECHLGCYICNGNRILP